jgi:VanZ family protein
MKAAKLKRLRRGRFIRYAPLFLWIAVIFTLSTGAGSFNRTSLIVGPVLRFLFPDVSAETLLFYHTIVRKAAHVFEYAVLALLAMWAFRPSRFSLLSGRPYAAAIIMVAVVASIDEFQQSFDPTRTGSIYDVVLDVAGGALALAAAWGAARWRSRGADAAG